MVINVRMDANFCPIVKNLSSVLLSTIKGSNRFMVSIMYNFYPLSKVLTGS